MATSRPRCASSTPCGSWTRTRRSGTSLTGGWRHVSRATCHEVTCHVLQGAAAGQLLVILLLVQPLRPRHGQLALLGRRCRSRGSRPRGHVSRVTCHAQEYERETTETVRRLLAEVEELFYAPPAARRQRKGSQVSAQERECQQWRDQFPSLR